MIERTDRGSATIWMLGLVALVILAAGLALVRTEAVLARHQVETAAELAALAGAQTIGIGTDPCASAARVAIENASTVTACSTDLDPSGRAGTVAVQLSRPVRLPLIGRRTVSAHAKAGRLEAVPAAGPLTPYPTAGQCPSNSPLAGTVSCPGAPQVADFGGVVPAMDGRQSR